MTDAAMAAPDGPQVHLPPAGHIERGNAMDELVRQTEALGLYDDEPPELP
jgi:hypothetical protein